MLVFKKELIMKKTIISAMLLSTLLVAGCSNEKKNESRPKTETVERPKQPKYYFKNDVVKIRDVKLEITKTKIINPGEKGNEYENKPVIAFWYKATNLSSKKIDPNTAWIAVFEAYQDNNKNQENKLEVASLPDEKYLSSQSNNIKKNGTVENAIAYKLSDSKTPVKLVATKGVDGRKLGTKLYKIK